MRSVSEDLFRAFVQQSRDGIVIIDSAGIILEWNEGEEQLTGIRREEALSRPIWDLQHRLTPDENRTPEQLRRTREAVLRGLQEGPDLRRTLEEEIQRPDGTRRVVQSILFGIRTAREPLMGGICRDVTERIRLEQELREGRAVLLEAERLANVGHFTWDLRNGRDSWSDEAYRMLGLAPGSIQPTREALLNAVAPEDRSRVAEALDTTARDGATRRSMFQVITAQGDVRHLQATVALCADLRNAPSCLIATAHDVTDQKRAEDALRESEQRFRAMADNAPVMIWVADSQGHNLFVNRAYCEFFGVGVNDVAGTAWQPLLHPDDAQAYIDAYHAALHEGSPLHAQVRVRHRDGSWRWLETYGAIRLSSSGEILGMVGASPDITARKRAEEALERSREDLRHAQAVAHVGSWRLSLPDNALQWSEETYRILGVAAGTTMTLERFLTSVHPDDRAHVIDSWQAALRGERYDIEHRIVVGEDVKWVREVGHIELDRDGLLSSGFGTVQDITDRKLMEQGLADAIKHKDEFLAMLSHELRNPLAPLRSGLDVLANSEPGSEQAQRMQAIIERQVRYLTRLVDDLLDVTRITRGKIQIQPKRVDLTAIVNRTMEDNRSTFLASGVELEGRTPVQPLWLAGDPTRLAQLVSNLLTNAAKFTPRGGHVIVSLEQASAQAVLHVQDTGVGITPALLDRLFEPFMQATRTLDRTRDGLGLGLALVKGIAELHGGSVAAASPGVDRGACFTVRLPLAATSEKVVAANDRRASRPRRVLIIEDNVDAAESLMEALKIAGHEVRVAHDGPEGIALARTFHPEIVLCDIGLPGLDGYEVARAFQADDELRGSFLVALTGYALPEDLQRAKQAGFRRHLTKPASFGQIAEILATAG